MDGGGSASDHGGSNRGIVDKDLDTLTSTELIREKQKIPELEYIFKHALVQESTYESILLKRRHELHGKVASAIETLFSDRLDEFVSVLAYHYAKAGGDSLPTGHERILFVDDETTLVEMGEEILTSLGYEVVTRTSGREALALFRRDPTRFDLVMTDQTMPDMTGMELAGEVRSLAPDKPVIVCTGFSTLVDEKKAQSAGVRAFAMKPPTKRGDRENDQEGPGRRREHIKALFRVFFERGVPLPYVEHRVKLVKTLESIRCKQGFNTPRALP